MNKFKKVSNFNVVIGKPLKKSRIKKAIKKMTVPESYKESLKEKIINTLNEAEKTYKFLDHVSNPDEDTKYLKLKDIPYDGSGEIDIDDSGKGEHSINIYYDSKQVANSYLTLNKKLTQEIQKDFEEDNSSGSWSEWREEWAKKNGFEIGNYGSGNTYNWDNYYFWGGVFEFTQIEKDNFYGIIIQWHLGGDVRGNYSYPEVWEGDVEEFFASQNYGDPETEIAYLLGYDKPKELSDDINEWYGEKTGKELLSPEEKERREYHARTERDKKMGQQFLKFEK